MTITDLVKELSKFNPNAEVYSLIDQEDIVGVELLFVVEVNGKPGLVFSEDVEDIV